MIISLAIHTSGAQPNDTVNTIATKLRMLVTGNVPSNDISVDTVDGMVTLYGKAPTEGDKRRADAEAKRTEGVLSVRDLLQIAPNVPTSTQRELLTHIAARIPGVPKVDTNVNLALGPPRTDAQIEAAIREERA